METASLEQGIGIIETKRIFGQSEMGDSEEFFDELLRSHGGTPDEEDDSWIQAAEEENGKDVVKEIADLVDKKLLGKKSQEENPGAKKSGRKSPGKNQKTSPEDSLYKRGLNEERTKGYRRIEDFFSYLGKLKTESNIYRDHLIEYSEKKAEEPAQRQEKRQDLDYNEFESIIRTKKMNDLMSGGKCGGVTANVNPATGGYFGFEDMSATSQEKWAVLSVFTYNKILSMLRYSMSLT